VSDLSATGWRTGASGHTDIARPASVGGFWSEFGIGGALQVGGSLMSIIGTYFAADTQKNQLKSQGLALDHEAAMSRFNARLAEQDALAIEEAGRQEAGQVALRYAAEKGAFQARTGASGVRMGRGSAAEVAASIDLAAELDDITINRNTVRAAGQRRMQAQDIRNRGSLAEVSARNVRGTASSIRPGQAAHGSLLSQFGQIATSQSRRRR
jgi:hypothetical protein